ncbi:MAG: acyltransferase [Opitutaceae bacterium]
MRTLARPILIAWRLAWLRAAGVTFGPDADIQGAVRIRRGFARGGRGELRFGRGVRISRGALIESWGGRIDVGDRVFIGPYAIVYGHGGVRVGDDTLISMHCRILSSDHTVPPPGVRINTQPDVLRATRIGSDVWLGAGVTVLGGVSIGDGCVVGAGSLVSQDLEANSVAMGAPARVVRKRA